MIGPSGASIPFMRQLAEHLAQGIPTTREKSSFEVVPALIRQMKRLPDELLRSLTWDRGSELAGHKQFALAADMAVYFCDPRSPWQRSSNENTNGLLRSVERGVAPAPLHGGRGRAWRAHPGQRRLGYGLPDP